ncbi:MAG: hypothetical protein KatS3mg090_0285 [Patescibacteria group bacterium]|nr:MAG: hypothetical protein KatS3mg090_0285 [Patescibacteria group bacterium]
MSKLAKKIQKIKFSRVGEARAGIAKRDCKFSFADE